jgi:hypothetical protein
MARCRPDASLQPGVPRNTVKTVNVCAGRLVTANSARQALQKGLPAPQWSEFKRGARKITSRLYRSEPRQISSTAVAVHVAGASGQGLAPTPKPSIYHPTGWF